MPALVQNMKLLKAVVQTEKLPIKVKSDVRRTLDGIFTNRFLLFQIELLLLHTGWFFLLVRPKILLSVRLQINPFKKVLSVRIS